jgi:hypothetical protein
MKYLLTTTEKYRVATVAEVEALHEEFLSDSNYTLASFGYTTKYIKAKGQIVEEYQVVTAKKVFNDEKEPESSIDVNYGMKGAF